MKDHTVVAYVFEGECYHPECLESIDALDSVFASEEEIETILCAGCHDPLVEEFDF